MTTSSSQEAAARLAALGIRQRPQVADRAADNSSRGLARPLRRSRPCALVGGRPQTGRNGAARGPHGLRATTELPGAELEAQRHATGSCRSPAFSPPARPRSSSGDRSRAFRPFTGWATSLKLRDRLFLVFAAAVLAPVSIHYRGHAELFVLTEVPLLLGLVIAAPPVLVAEPRRRRSLRVRGDAAPGAVEARVQRLLRRLGDRDRHHGLPGAFDVGHRARRDGRHQPERLGCRCRRPRPPPPCRPRRRGDRGAHLRIAPSSASTGFEVTTFALVLVSSIALALVVLDAAWWDIWAVAAAVARSPPSSSSPTGAICPAHPRFGVTAAALRLQQVARNGRTSRPLHERRACSSRCASVMRASRAELFLAELAGVPFRHVALDDQEPLAGRTHQPSTASSFVTKAITSGAASMRSRPTSDQRGIDLDPIAGEYHAVHGRAARRAETRASGPSSRSTATRSSTPSTMTTSGSSRRLAAHASATIERARLVEELRLEVASNAHQATHDSLTGLANRTLFLDPHDTALDENAGVAIALLDLDRFKEVNDTLGHPIGDRLLCEVAERLVRACPRAGDGGPAWWRRVRPRRSPASSGLQRPRASCTSSSTPRRRPWTSTASPWP